MKIHPEIKNKCKKESAEHNIVDQIEGIKGDLEKKNIIWDFKLTEPPHNLLGNSQNNFTKHGEDGDTAFKKLKNCQFRRCQLYKN